MQSADAGKVYPRGKVQSACCYGQHTNEDALERADWYESISLTISKRYDKPEADMVYFVGGMIPFFPHDQLTWVVDKWRVFGTNPELRTHHA